MISPLVSSIYSIFPFMFRLTLNIWNLSRKFVLHQFAKNPRLSLSMCRQGLNQPPLCSKPYSKLSNLQHETGEPIPPYIPLGFAHSSWIHWLLVSCGLLALAAENVQPLVDLTGEGGGCEETHHKVHKTFTLLSCGIRQSKTSSWWVTMTPTLEKLCPKGLSVCLVFLSGSLFFLC